LKQEIEPKELTDQNAATGREALVEELQLANKELVGKLAS